MERQIIYSKKGSALSQYGIIIVLVALALVPVFFLAGSYLTNYFKSFYQTMNSSSNGSGQQNNNTNSYSQAIINGNVTAGLLGGTSEKPVQMCEGDVCAIDFGTFVLNGVPANFSEYVQSNGVSGGTDDLIALLEQLANSPNIPPDQANLIGQLANLGHALSTRQKSVERMAGDLTSTTYDSWRSNGYSTIQDNTAFTDKLGEVMASLNGHTDPDSNNIRGIVNLLSNNIMTMNNDLLSCCNYIDTTIEDITNGTVTSTAIDPAVEGLLHPMTSVNTNVSSSIICTTGHGEDNGIQCH